MAEAVDSATEAVGIGGLVGDDLPKVVGVVVVEDENSTSGDFEEDRVRGFRSIGGLDIDRGGPSPA